jgi:hypothetical protein
LRRKEEKQGGGGAHKEREKRGTKEKIILWSLRFDFHLFSF